MANNLLQQDLFAVNPLDDPLVRATLEQIQMSGKDLMESSVKDLNKRLLGCPTATISRLKKCRRTLKNRGYAKNCRIKRLCLKNELEQTNAKLRAEIKELKLRNKLLQRQINELRVQAYGSGQDLYHHDTCPQEFMVQPHQTRRQDTDQYSFEYGFPTNVRQSDTHLQQSIQPIRYFANSSNASPLSSSSSTSCFEADRSITSISNLTDSRQEFLDNKDWIGRCQSSWYQPEQTDYSQPNPY